MTTGRAVDAARELLDGLTDDQADLLDFERQWWKSNGAKETAIRDRWPDDGPTRYYQRLNALLGDPAALAYDPLLVRRLTRLRDARRAQRATARALSS